MASEYTAGYNSAENQKYIAVKCYSQRNHDGDSYRFDSPEGTGDEGEGSDDYEDYRSQGGTVQYRCCQGDNILILAALLM